MSYIIVLEDDKLKESLINDFFSGKECLILHKNNVNKIIKTNKSLDEYCLEYADKLFYENCHRISSMGPDEIIKFCSTPMPNTININNKLGTYAPSAIKAMLDEFENEKDRAEKEK